MVDEEAVADLGRRVDLDPGERPRGAAIRRGSSGTPASCSAWATRWASSACTPGQASRISSDPTPRAAGSRLRAAATSRRISATTRASVPGRACPKRSDRAAPAGSRRVAVPACWNSASAPTARRRAWRRSARPSRAATATMRLPSNSGRLRDLDRGPHRGAAGDPRKHALAAREQHARGLERVLVVDRDDLVEHVAVQHRGHEAGADALDLVRARAARPTAPARTSARRRPRAASGLRSLSTSPTPVIVPPVPTPATNASTLPSVSRQISSAGRAAVDLRVGGVRELVGQEARRRAPRRSRAAASTASFIPPSDSVIWTRGAVEPQQALALAAHALRHRQHELVALGRADERQRDAGVAAGRLDDRRAARLDPALALGGLDHRHADPVLDAAAGLNISSLANSSAPPSGAPASAAPSACGRHARRCWSGFRPLWAGTPYAKPAPGRRQRWRSCAGDTKRPRRNWDQRRCGAVRTWNRPT